MHFEKCYNICLFIGIVDFSLLQDSAACNFLNDKLKGARGGEVKRKFKIGDIMLVQHRNP